MESGGKDGSLEEEVIFFFEKHRRKLIFFMEKHKNKIKLGVTGWKVGRGDGCWVWGGQGRSGCGR